METEKKSHGALIGSIIIIIILLIGGIYTWQMKVKSDLNKKQIQEENVSDTTNYNELNNLEQEINTTDPNVDVDTSKIE